MRPLHVAFVWHMHQPYYKDDLTATYLLPWVRLRAGKDYYKMAALLDGYPNIRQTFNLVPSLLAQIEDYSTGDYQDLFLNLSRRPAEDLDADERAFVLKWMRESPATLRVQSSQRYLELAGRRQDQAFSVDDLRDIQVWFNLAWCDPAWLESDPALTALKAKDRNFSEEDKEALFAAQLAMVGRVIPKYRELAARGQAELTFSPYYHPILPLLCQVDSARTAEPQIVLPERPFSHREDAERQIELGLSAFQRIVGHRPQGMWPPEMAVGESVASLAIAAGLEWLISDQEVLARSLGQELGRDSEGRLQQPEVLYSPHLLEREGGHVRMVFRDSLLSNLIGFDYQRMRALEAAGDLIGRLRRIREQQRDDDLLVTIALDGENPWEYYSRDGHDFLNALYDELESAEDLVTTTVGDFLNEHPGGRKLHRLHTGSWIGASLDTWIGDPQHNVAWVLLAETRDWLQDYAEHHPGEREQVAAAWREILITEGSDWFWWFSRKHDSGMDAIWDNQFRLHLRNVYRLVGGKPPARLFQPIIERAQALEMRLPTDNFTPTRISDPAWEKAGRFEVGSGFGALHKPVGFVQNLLYGCDEQSLHLRIDSPVSLRELAAARVSFWIFCSGPLSPLPVGHQRPFPLPIRPSTLDELDFEPGFLVHVETLEAGGQVTVGRMAESRDRAVPVFDFMVANPLLLSIPFQALGKRGGEPMQLALTVVQEGRDVEQIPPVGSLGLRVPSHGGLRAREGGGRLRVLIASAEVSPFAKAGGLADVSAALAKELRRQGHDVRLVLPRYRQVSIDGHGLRRVVESVGVRLGAQVIECAVFEGRLHEVPVYFLDCPRFFDRDGIYGFGDDDARFIYFSRAVLQILRPLDFMPDVIHVNDWHTALVPNLLDRVYADDPELGSIATVLTVHNLAFQGTFGSGALHLAGLEEWGLIRVGIPHLDDIFNILGRGIHFADAFNTVSERYAREIQTPEYGEGLDELIKAHGHKLYGIVNGIDYEVFDPAGDPALPEPYTATDLSGKALAKTALRRELGLAQTDTPLVTMVSRLYEQKGLDLVEQALPMLLGMDLQLAVLGTGDRRYEDMFRFHAGQHPGSLATFIGFDAKLVHLLYAGADLYLMPSRFEPCGLGQLISLRYGTIPIVRATGGLVDTIQDVDPRANTGFGFVFQPYDAWHLVAAIVRAMENYRHQRFWRDLVRRAMSQDVSWAHSARRYAELYKTAILSHRERRGLIPSSASQAG